MDENLMKYFTLPLEGQEGTLTYFINKLEVYEDGQVRALLEHPLAKKILIPFTAKSENELLLSQTQTQGKSNMQRWVEFVVRNSEKVLDARARQNAEGLALLFVVNRNLTNLQKGQLAKLSGEISSIQCNNDVNLCIRLVKENIVLLDYYNRLHFDLIIEQLEKPGKDGKPRFPSEGQRNTLFNIAGFVLSQVEG